MELLSVQEATKILKVSRQQVNLYIRFGKLKAQKVGKAYIIKSTDLEKFKNN